MTNTISTEQYAALGQHVAALLGANSDWDGAAEYLEEFAAVAQSKLGQPVGGQSDEGLAFWRKVADELGIEHDGPDESTSVAFVSMGGEVPTVLTDLLIQAVAIFEDAGEEIGNAEVYVSVDPNAIRDAPSGLLYPAALIRDGDGDLIIHVTTPEHATNLITKLQGEPQ